MISWTSIANRQVYEAERYNFLLQTEDGRVTVANFYASGTAQDRIELFRLADGTTRSADSIVSNIVIRGTDGADVLDGGEGADTMSGGGGSDLYRLDDAGDGHELAERRTRYIIPRVSRQNIFD